MIECDEAGLTDEPLILDNVDDFLTEAALKKYVGTPIGHCLKEQLAYNKSLPIRDSLEKVYAEEHVHIANPLDYLGTVPDSIVRWKVS